MSREQDYDKSRPYSAGVPKLFQARPLSSNCPTILRHEVANSAESPLDFNDFNPPRERPLTSTSAMNKRLGTSGSANFKGFMSPSNVSMRPNSGQFNSFVNMEFVESILKNRNRFKDRSNIRPLKRIKTDQFHTVIYKVKQQKEELEKKINRLEMWQKEINKNDIWNTPQATVVDSILEMHARHNPEGVVNQYLQTEKEKSIIEKERKKSMIRPLSSASFKSIRNAKSVSEFFRNYDENDLIHDALTSPKENYNTEADISNRKEITEKIHHYMNNMGNFRKLIESNKYLIASRGDIENDSEIVEDPLIVYNKGGKQGSKLSIETSNDAGLYRLQNVHISNDSMKVQPKGQQYTIQTPTLHMSASTSPKGFLVIHSRPGTATKKITPSSSTLITNEIMSSKANTARFFKDRKSLGLVGSKILIKPINELMTRPTKRVETFQRDNLSLQERVNFIKEDEDHSGPRARTALTNARMRLDSRGGEAAKRIIHSAKSPSDKLTIGTQTQDTPGSVGKVNIDGEYFEGISSPAEDLKKKSVIKSWIDSEQKPGGTIVEVKSAALDTESSRK